MRTICWKLSLDLILLIWVLYVILMELSTKFQKYNLKHLENIQLMIVILIWKYRLFILLLKEPLDKKQFYQFYINLKMEQKSMHLKAWILWTYQTQLIKKEIKFLMKISAFYNSWILKIMEVMLNSVIINIGVHLLSLLAKKMLFGLYMLNLLKWEKRMFNSFPKF
jgi:hypothetical protein